MASRAWASSSRSWWRPIEVQELRVAIFDLPNGAFGPDRTEALCLLASEIADQPGLVWKIWTRKPAGVRAGGIYLFATRAAVGVDHGPHAARLAARGALGCWAGSALPRR